MHYLRSSVDQTCLDKHMPNIQADCFGQALWGCTRQSLVCQMELDLGTEYRHRKAQR